MINELNLLRQTRIRLLSLAESLNEEQLTTIPAGFKNNLLWNIGHVVVTQQMLCYGLAGRPMKVNDESVSMLRKGSSPAQWQQPPDFSKIKQLILPAVDDLAADYKAERFNDFERYETSYGVTLSCIEDAIQFNNLHEGVHIGYALALRRALNQQ